MAEETDNQAEEEPSIEEILASIRQIISDDDEEGGEEEASEPTEEPAVEAPAEDIVELTEEVAAEDAPEPEPKLEETPEPEPEEEADDVDISMEEPEPEEEPEPDPIAEDDISFDEPEPEPEIMPEPETESDPEEMLLTDRAEEAAMAGFGELVRKTKIEHSGITLEEIVRAELRPMLKDWLDDNLPPIIERLVQEELERVAKRALEEL
ncbi:MAG: DUF2497 domain-containing protein [Alphaproteobacteria bacterium]